MNSLSLIGFQYGSISRIEQEQGTGLPLDSECVAIPVKPAAWPRARDLNNQKTGQGIPDPDRGEQFRVPISPISGNNKPSFRIVPDVHYTPRVFTKDRKLPPQREVPDPGRSVHRSRNETATVRAERDRQHAPLVTSQHA